MVQDTVTFLKRVSAQYGARRPCTVQTQWRGKLIARRPSLLARCRYELDKDYAMRHDRNMAAILLRFVEQCPDSPHLVKAAKAFLRHVGKSSREAALRPKLRPLRVFFVSQRYQLSVAAFEANPHLELFLERNHLFHYLGHYGHQLNCDARSGEMLIKVDDEWQPWSWVKENLPMDDFRVKDYVYRREGFVKGDTVDWEEWKPFDWADPRGWETQYILELCSNCGDKPRVSGDHSWFRVRTPEGDIYSVGLYRPDKPRRRDQYILPMRVKAATLFSPDVSEFWPEPYTSWQVRITHQDFLKIKEQIEVYKKLGGNIYQLFHDNCTSFVGSIGALAGLNIPTKMPVIRAIIPQRVQRLAQRIQPYVPRVVERIVVAVTVVFVNFLQIMFGGTVVDRDVKNGNGGGHFGPALRLLDIFSKDKVCMHHPYVLGQVARKEVEEWRQDRIAEIQREIDRIQGLIDKGGLDGPELLEHCQHMERLGGEKEWIRYDVPDRYRAEPQSVRQGMADRASCAAGACHGTA